jgi:thiol-disulfide isomerase/thioredoxin
VRPSNVNRLNAALGSSPLGCSRRPALWAVLSPVVKVLALAMGAAGVAGHAIAQDNQRDPSAFVNAIANRSRAAQRYSVEGEIELAKKDGERSRETLVRSRIKLSVGPQGQYFLSVGDASRPDYLLISDGTNTWAYVPYLKKYVKHDAHVVGIPQILNETLVKDIVADTRDLLACSLLIVPILSHLDQSAVLTEMNREAILTYKGEQQQLPVLTVLSRGETPEAQALTELVVDPESAALARVEWTKKYTLNDETHWIYLRADFTNFEIFQPLAPASFGFDPGDAIERVEDLPLPGLDGSELLNRPAPDFELKQADGRKIALSGLRGRVVVLAFGASSCASCRQQLEALTKIQDEFKESAPAIFALDNEGAADARRYSAGVQRLYHVRFLPTVVVINPRGEVVRFLWGARDIDSLRSILKTAEK